MTTKHDYAMMVNGECGGASTVVCSASRAYTELDDCPLDARFRRAQAWDEAAHVPRRGAADGGRGCSGPDPWTGGHKFEAAFKEGLSDFVGGYLLNLHAYDPRQ